MLGNDKLQFGSYVVKKKKETTRIELKNVTRVIQMSNFIVNVYNVFMRKVSNSHLNCWHTGI